MHTHTQTHTKTHTYIYSYISFPSPCHSRSTSSSPSVSWPSCLGTWAPPGLPWVGSPPRPPSGAARFWDSAVPSYFVPWKGDSGLVFVLSVLKSMTSDSRSVCSRHWNSSKASEWEQSQRITHICVELAAETACAVEMEVSSCTVRIFFHHYYFH